MKKIIALILSCLVCAACFSVFATAEEYDSVASLLPNPDGEMVTEGCDVVVNANGSVTITLTAEKGKVKMIYKDGDTILEEPYSVIANYPYVAYWYDSDVEKFEAHAHYDRKDKIADLYLSGMQANPNFYEAGDKDSSYGVWSLYDYLVKKGADYVEGDYAVLKFFDIEYELQGKVGDTVTIYYFGTMSDIPEGFGTDVPETPSEEPSDEPIVESSEEPSEETSAPTAESSAPATSSEKPTEPTSDNGIVALVAIAAIALVGAYTVKKVR